MTSDIYRRGSCVQLRQHHLFFSSHPSDLAAAQEICAGCEVRGACLQLALNEGMEWGVWGGVIFEDGRALLRKRGRGRPRNEERHLPLEADLDGLTAEILSA